MNTTLARVILPTLGAVLLMAAASTTRHLTMVKSYPMKDSVTTAVPESIQVWFNEDPVVAVSRLWLEGAQGEVKLGATRGGADRSIVAHVEGDISPGKYTVTWRTAGDDGHAMRRSFEFTLAPRSDWR